MWVFQDPWAQPEEPGVELNSAALSDVYAMGLGGSRKWGFRVI